MKSWNYQANNGALL